MGRALEEIALCTDATIDETPYLTRWHVGRAYRRTPLWTRCFRRDGTFKGRWSGGRDVERERTGCRRWQVRAVAKRRTADGHDASVRAWGSGPKQRGGGDLRDALRATAPTRH
jgi:hypothetical protein